VRGQQVSIVRVLFSVTGFRQALKELPSITGVPSEVTSVAPYPYASFGLCDHDVRSPILDGSNAEVLITECPGVRLGLSEISPGEPERSTSSSGFPEAPALEFYAATNRFARKP
jgi:hypothetical protein